jgi:hypothetical protein
VDRGSIGPGLGFLILCAAGPALSACGGDPGREFAQLEQELLRRPELQVSFHITSQGAFAAELEGVLTLGAGSGTSLVAEGTFGDEPVTLSLSASEGQMSGGSQERTFQEPLPNGMREALVIGLTRMGLLHNLARLVAGSPPDRADGSVREWVQVRNVAWEPGRGDIPGSRGLRFDIWVGGRAAGEGTLWLDVDGEGPPVLREQIVRFPGGEMRVTERYETG